MSSDVVRIAPETPKKIAPPIEHVRDHVFNIFAFAEFIRYCRNNTTKPTAPQANTLVVNAKFSAKHVIDGCSGEWDADMALKVLKIAYEQSAKIMES